MKRFGMIQRDEGYPTEMVECDDGPFVLFDEVESRESLAVSAAVMQERQKIIAALQVLRDADEKHEGTAVYGIGLAQAVVKARPSPAVDVMAIVREFLDAKAPMKGPYTNDELNAWNARYTAALAALRSLVDGTLKAETRDGSISDIERTLDRMYARREEAEAKDGGAEG